MKTHNQHSYQEQYLKRDRKHSPQARFIVKDSSEGGGGVGYKAIKEGNTRIAQSQAAQSNTGLRSNLNRDSSQSNVAKSVVKRDTTPTTRSKAPPNNYASKKRSTSPISREQLYGKTLTPQKVSLPHSSISPRSRELPKSIPSFNNSPNTNSQFFTDSTAFQQNQVLQERISTQNHGEMFDTQQQFQKMVPIKTVIDMKKAKISQATNSRSIFPVTFNTNTKEEIFNSLALLFRIQSQLQDIYVKKQQLLTQLLQDSDADLRRRLQRDVKRVQEFMQTQTFKQDELVDNFFRVQGLEKQGWNNNDVPTFTASPSCLNSPVDDLKIIIPETANWMVYNSKQNTINKDKAVQASLLDADVDQHFQQKTSHKNFYHSQRQAFRTLDSEQQAAIALLQGGDFQSCKAPTENMLQKRLTQELEINEYESDFSKSFFRQQRALSSLSPPAISPIRGGGGGEEPNENYKQLKPEEDSVQQGVNLVVPHTRLQSQELQSFKEESDDMAPSYVLRENNCYLANAKQAQNTQQQVVAVTTKGKRKHTPTVEMPFAQPVSHKLQ